MYFGCFIIISTTLRWTLLDNFFFPTTDILNDNRDEYYYMTPDYRMPIDKWNEFQEELKKVDSLQVTS